MVWMALCPWNLPAVMVPVVVITCTPSTCHLSPACGRRRRKPAAYSGPNFSHHCRIVSWETMIPPGHQGLFDLMEGEREAVIELHSMGDDLRREPETPVRHHRPGPPQPTPPQEDQQTRRPSQT